MKSVLLAAASGFAAGLSAVLLKLGGFSLFIPAGIIGLASFAFFFFALSKGKTVLVAPVSGAANTLTTVLAGTMFLGESLGMRQILAIVLLFAGSALLAEKK